MLSKSVFQLVNLSKSTLKVLQTANKKATKKGQLNKLLGMEISKCFDLRLNRNANISFGLLQNQFKPSNRCSAELEILPQIQTAHGVFIHHHHGGSL